MFPKVNTPKVAITLLGLCLLSAPSLARPVASPVRAQARQKRPYLGRRLPRLAGRVALAGTVAATAFHTSKAHAEPIPSPHAAPAVAAHADGRLGPGLSLAYYDRSRWYGGNRVDIMMHLLPLERMTASTFQLRYTFLDSGKPFFTEHGPQIGASRDPVDGKYGFTAGYYFGENVQLSKNAILGFGVTMTYTRAHFDGARVSVPLYWSARDRFDMTPSLHATLKWD